MNQTLHEEIRRESECYRRDHTNYVRTYDTYFADKKYGPSKWRNKDSLSQKQAEALFQFLFDFGVMHLRRMKDEDKKKERRNLRENVQWALKWTTYLAGKSIADVDFNEEVETEDQSMRIREVMINAYNAAEGIGARPTMTSKILHVINPELFVMWDEKIIRYVGTGDTASGYVDSFLPEMQRLAVEAISDAMTAEGISDEDAVKLLTSCSHPLAKVLDEYNFMKSR